MHVLGLAGMEVVCVSLTSFLVAAGEPLALPCQWVELCARPVHGENQVWLPRHPNSPYHSQSSVATLCDRPTQSPSHTVQHHHQFLEVLDHEECIGGLDSFERSKVATHKQGNGKLIIDRRLSPGRVARKARSPF